tara:strand:+ start:1853 stop:2677 length:825 start_codon:yes stop_codon:yes gene_type:complete
MQRSFGEKSLKEDLIRHMILNSLRFIKRKFGEEYGELVICSDDRDYWRKAIFPHYKAHRRVSQDSDDIDWKELFRILNKIRDEIHDYFPWRSLRVEHAEADDIIGTLCEKFGKEFGSQGEPILIVSSDKDFKQLQKYVNVKQYSPIQKKWIKESNPVDFLIQHIMEGDKGDGIPNFLSDDDALLPNGGAKKQLRKKKVAEWSNNLDLIFNDETLLRGWKRNEALIDLAEVPQNIKDEVMRQWELGPKTKGNDLFEYFMKRKLKNLMSDIAEFMT